MKEIENQLEEAIERMEKSRIQISGAVEISQDIMRTVWNTYKEQRS